MAADRALPPPHPPNQSNATSCNRTQPPPTDPSPQVLENLKNRAEELVRQHVPEELARSLLKASGRGTFSSGGCGVGGVFNCPPVCIQVSEDN